MLVEIQYVNNYNVTGYGDCLIVHACQIVDSPFGWGGIPDITLPVTLLYPYTKKNHDYIQRVKRNGSEYFDFPESAFKLLSVDGYGDCYVSESFFRNDDGVSNMEGCPVDLGLSVLWANMNVGSKKETDNGILFGYGDVNGELDSEDEDDYIKESIVNTDNDIAKANWGEKWRMPTTEELTELAKKCKWNMTTQNGVKGHQVIGPNGNSIFIPFSGVRMGISTLRVGQIGILWSGTLKEGEYTYALMHFGNHTMVTSQNASNGVCVRPVMDK